MDAGLSMMQVPLTRGAHAVVDDEDQALVDAYKWSLLRSCGNEYAVTDRVMEGKRRTLLMHRLILGTPAGLRTDHIDGNGLNNRRANLRVATAHQNQANRGSVKGSTSGFKGVCWHKASGGRWEAKMQSHGRTIHLGLFRDEEEAARTYDEAARAEFGEFGRFNFPLDGEMRA